MKTVVSLLCWIIVGFCIYFPISYFHSEMDKKEVKISHILVKTEEEAQQIKEEIKNGKTFEEMASTYSLCPSKEQKGDIGFNIRGRLFPEIETIAFKSKLKEVSEPVQSQEGWHLVKVYDAKYFSDKENFIKRKI